MKKLCATLLCLALCMGVLPVRAAGPEVNARAALLMEKSTGQVCTRPTPTRPWSWPASPR